MLKSLMLAGATRCYATPGEATADAGEMPAVFKRSPDEPGQRKPGDHRVEAKTPAEAKPVKAKKGKVVKAKHKPSEVTATEANPQKSIVPVRFKERYADHGDSNGDRVALALKTATTTKNADGRPATDMKALAAIAEANGIDMKAYAKLNPGMQRMNVGNRLRGMLKNEKPVVIGKQRFADWEKAKVVAPPKAKTEAKAAA